MAVNNSLVPRIDDLKAVYKVNGEEIRLTPKMVKMYLVSGDPTNVSDQEVSMFINLCKYNKLNPWLKEAYLIKFGNSPATLVVGKEAYMKRAEAHPNYDGMECGVIVQNEERITYRTGSVVLDGEMVVGGWAEVFRNDRNHSTRCEVSFNEYAGLKKDGTLNTQWSSKPATMIRKVAMVQALREAFPTLYGAMYTAEEQGYTEEETAIDIPLEMNNDPMPDVKPEPVEVVSDGLPL